MLEVKRFMSEVCKRLDDNQNLLIENRNATVNKDMAVDTIKPILPEFPLMSRAVIIGFDMQLKDNMKLRQLLVNYLFITFRADSLLYLSDRLDVPF